MRTLTPSLRDRFDAMNQHERNIFILGMLRHIYRAFVFFLLLGMVWMIWAAMLARGVSNRNAMESAQVARHLTEGDGFTTSIIRPLSLYYFPSVVGHPDLASPPFMTVLKAALFNLAGATDRMVYLASGLGWIVCAFFIFYMVRDLAGRRGLALYAVALWCTNIAAAQYAVDGDNVTWAAAFLTAALWCMYRGGQRAEDARIEKWTREVALRELPAGWALLSGISATLLTLCEPALSLCAWLPLIWSWLRWPARANLPTYRLVTDETINWKNRNITLAGYQLRLAWPLLGPGLLILGTWYGYGFIRTWPNHPGVLRAFMASAFSSEFPGESVFRFATPPFDMPVIYWFSQLRDAAADSLRSLIPLPEALVYLAGLVPLAFFFAGFFMALDTRIQSLRRSLYVPFLFALLSMSLWSMNARYLSVFIPCLLVVSVMVMHHVFAARWKGEISIPDSPSMRLWVAGLLRRAWHVTRRHQIYAIFLCLSAIPAITLRMNLPSKAALQVPPGLEHIIQHSRADDVIMTDDPWIVAWYAQRTAVWLPQREQDMETLKQRGLDIDWIYLSNAAITDPREIGEWWPELVEDPGGWRDFTSIQKRFGRERVLQKRAKLAPELN